MTDNGYPTVDEGAINPDKVRTNMIEDAKDGQAWETIKELGFEKGDFYPLYTFSTRTNLSKSITSSSYQVSVEVNEAQIIADNVPGTVAYKVDYRANPNGDTVYCNYRNATDGELVTGSEGSVSAADWSNFSVGPNEYTPTTTSGPVTLQPQFRNSDGTTSVSLAIAQLTIGTFL